MYSEFPTKGTAIGTSVQIKSPERAPVVLNKYPVENAFCFWTALFDYVFDNYNWM